MNLNLTGLAEPASFRLRPVKWLAVLVNGSLRQYFTMYRPIFQREGE